ncbi:squalene--hopene cyclase [Salinisphaera sp. Q1T1-3]|uniref:squalene--hopene cyclase n=1 Tax=Salinisphaera sp. Q1T1-3 TaxID=2321229 RepID=UPI000E73F59A|nr:squalene--hopene cyclase [Salinisphaera sp. Q1T1-3]RJS93970.1 squalene--hopene cyclase [Salinisphaera sp. Q1T1-3]
MSQAPLQTPSGRLALAFQDEILPHVSRTFALTIPELPEPLRIAIGNAYLLCRIADTIEDDAEMARADKAAWHAEFVNVVESGAGAAAFGTRLAPQLSAATLDEERRLVAHTADVLTVTLGLGANRQAAIARCVRIMCAGMPEYEGAVTSEGLPTLAHLDRYCYFVAGVVGEMLTSVFTDYEPEIGEHDAELNRLAVSFGQGLQMTNILKDIWADRERGVCWLPRDLFARHGYDLSAMADIGHDPAFAAGLSELIGLAHGHLRNALEYTLRIPGEQKGMRRFCLWAIGLALLTLRKIQANPHFTHASQVKVSRRTVQATVLTTNLAVSDDDRLRYLFHMTAGELPALTPKLADDPAAPINDIASMPKAQAPRVAPPAGLEAAIEAAASRLHAEQKSDGHWCYECEADCTIPAEYIMMMHFVGDIDRDVQARVARFIRHKQAAHGGWPLYYGGDMDLSCSVKCYYALKLAGDDVDAPHMVHAREAIRARGGAGQVNVFTLIALAQFGQVPWRAVPFIPVEVMLMPEISPFHLSKVSYWSRTVMVPLFILTSLRAMAKNPAGVNVRELFTVPPEQQRDFVPVSSPLQHLFKGLDAVGRRVEPLIPQMVRKRAIRKAEAWIIERLNGEDGIGAIFPAMVNVYEALGELGYAADHPYRASQRKALDDLVFEHGEMANVQPCVSPVWDTGLGILALQEAAGQGDTPPVRAGLDWLAARQVLDGAGDWRRGHPELAGGGWPFQYANDHYPDLDDTAVIAWAMYNTGDHATYGRAITRATDWLVGMQSANGGVAAFDSDNNHEYLNAIPFADHGALLDPPTADVTARVLTLAGLLKRPQDRPFIRRALAYLKRTQEADGSWFGRWGTNYVYGTWSVLTALEVLGEDMNQDWIQRAVAYLKGMQRTDGSWGEDNGTYWDPPRGRADVSTSFQTAWAMLGLMAAGERDTPALARGAAWLIARQASDGIWHDPEHTAPGFPRVFYLKYHGYTRYFPMWALARYRNLHGATSPMTVDTIETADEV